MMTVLRQIGHPAKLAQPGSCAAGVSFCDRWSAKLDVFASVGARILGLIEINQVSREIGTSVICDFTASLRSNLIRVIYGAGQVKQSVTSIMTEQQFRARVRYVIGPDGSPLTVADLPPKDTKRWVIRRKAEVVAAVRSGLLSLEEACERYKLTVDEFLSWQRSIDRFGMPGLRATRVQDYRE